MDWECASDSTKPTKTPYIYFQHEEEEDYGVDEILNQDDFNVIFSNQSTLDIRGLFGSVFRGVYDGKPVAVKIFKPLAGTNESEVASLLALSPHPNLVHIYHVFRHNFDPIGPVEFIVMELAEQGTLRDYLDTNWPLSHTLLRSLALDIALGLSALHDRGIVHSDLRSANVLLTNRAGRLHAVLTDFGLACILPQSHASSTTSVPSTTTTTTTTTNTTTTTSAPLEPSVAPLRRRRSSSVISENIARHHWVPLAWTAPEVLATKAYAGPAADVYSFGSILWEMLTGKSPENEPLFADRAVEDIVADLEAGKRLTLPVSTLTSLIKWCWETVPAARPTTREIVHHLTT